MKISENSRKSRFVILVAAIVLLIPAAWGMLHTRVNYDVPTYLPDDIETMQGQKILKTSSVPEPFPWLGRRGHGYEGCLGAEDGNRKSRSCQDVIWYDSFVDLSVPGRCSSDGCEKRFL